MPDWSEGSVFVLLGIVTEDRELTLEGFKMIEDGGHTLAPTLITMLYDRLKKAGVVEPHETEDKEKVLEWIPSWIDVLENNVSDSEAVEAFLADISKDYN
jgi:hypothetical protein